MARQDWNNILVPEQYAEFKNQHILVAGGAAGIGAELVSAFHWLGAKVSILDKDLAQSSSDGLVRGFQADLAVEEQREAAVRQALEAFGPPRVFISTVAIDERVDFDTLTQSKFEKLFSANFTGPFFTAKSFLEPMRKGGGGAMCIFTSDHGSQLFEPDMTPYGVAKAALINADQRLAIKAGEENSPDNNIRIFSFSPGWTQTENQKRRFPTEVFEAAAQNEQLVRVSMQPEDVVEPVLFLVSSRAKFYTPGLFEYKGGINHRLGGGINASAGRANKPKL